MKKIKLIPVEIDEEFDDYESIGAEEGRSWNFEFDLTPYVITCAISCVLLFVVRLIEKRLSR